MECLLAAKNRSAITITALLLGAQTSVLCLDVEGSERRARRVDMRKWVLPVPGGPWTRVMERDVVVLVTVTESPS